MKWANSTTVGNSRAKAVLLALAWEHRDLEPQVKASASKLARMTELDIKTIPKAVDHLVRGGFIVRLRSQGTTNCYGLNIGATTPENGVGDRGATLPKNGAGRDDSTAPENGVGGEEGVQVDFVGPPPKTDHPQIRVGTTPENGSGPPPKTGDSLREEKKPIKKQSSRIPKQEDEKYLRFARYMWDKIEPITKQTKEPNFNSWARELRLLTTADGRTEADVRRVFAWANAEGNWWRANILCAATLRKQFPKLYAQFQEAHHAQPRSGTGTNQNAGRLSGVERTRALRQERRRESESSP